MFSFYHPSDDTHYQYKLDETPDERQFYKHVHNMAELFLILEGNASFNIEGVVYKLHPYDLVMIPAHSYHCLILESTAPYERFVFNIHPSRPPFDVGEIFSRPRILNIAQRPELMGVFMRLREYAAQYPEEDLEKLTPLLLQESLILLKKTAMQSTESTQNALTREIISYINRNLFSPITIDDIAKHFYLSKSHVQNVFYKNMQTGIKSYIMRKKMSIADAQLQKGEKPVDVARRLGFQNYTVFFKNFTHTYGKSPKQRKGDAT